MQSPKELKEIVKSKYSSIAVNSMRQTKSCGCCCSGKNNTPEYSMIGDEYYNVDGYVKEADLNLGCGLPTKYAGIKPGDTVLDLGSGAGNDVFVARQLTGETGKVIGLDFTTEMIQKAELNKQKLGFINVEFKHGDIENIPVENNSVDVVISNCVMNLVPDKERAFSEVYRVLKEKGHFCISDIVMEGEMPEELKTSAAAYTGCVSGALQKNEYLKIIADAGFNNVEIKTQKNVDLPDEILSEYLNADHSEKHKTDNPIILSVTVVGYKV